MYLSGTRGTCTSGTVSTEPVWATGYRIPYERHSGTCAIHYCRMRSHTVPTQPVLTAPHPTTPMQVDFYLNSTVGNTSHVFSFGVEEFRSGCHLTLEEQICSSAGNGSVVNYTWGYVMGWRACNEITSRQLSSLSHTYSQYRIVFVLQRVRV